jgi:hypothetical protein
MQNNQNPCKVITGTVRLSYANVWEPASINGSPAKYSASLIIPKADTKTIDAINKAIDAAIVSGKGKFGGKALPRTALKLPLRDGDVDRPDDEAYTNSFFLNANSKTAPQIVDLARNPITDHEQLYSGAYIRTSIVFYPYNTSGNRGIACGLGNIQKIRDGEPLGGRTNARDDFNDNFATEDGGDDFLS